MTLLFAEPSRHYRLLSVLLLVVTITFATPPTPPWGDVRADIKTMGIARARIAFQERGAKFIQSVETESSPLTSRCSALHILMEFTYDWSNAEAETIRTAGKVDGDFLQQSWSPITNYVSFVTVHLPLLQKQLAEMPEDKRAMHQNSNQTNFRAMTNAVANLRSAAGIGVLTETESQK